MVLSIIWNRTWKEDEQIKATKGFCMIVYGFDHPRKEKNFFDTLRLTCKKMKKILDIFSRIKEYLDFIDGKTSYITKPKTK
jgi:hypothetical protein